METPWKEELMRKSFMLEYAANERLNEADFGLNKVLDRLTEYDYKLTNPDNDSEFNE